MRKRIFETEAAYRARLARETDERAIEDATGSPPAPGVFESDGDYQDRVSHEANLLAARTPDGSFPSRRVLESDEEFRARVAREAAEKTVESSKGEAPRQRLLESGDDYRSRLAREAAEATLIDLTGSRPLKGFFEGDAEYLDRITREAMEASASRQRVEQHSTGGRARSGRASDESSEDTAAVFIKIGLWLALIVALIVAVLAAVFVALLLSPVWLGATAAGVVAGFVLAPGVFRRLSRDTLDACPWVVARKRGKLPINRPSPDFLRSAVPFFPYGIILFGVALAYASSLAALPLLRSPNRLSAVLIGASVAVGSILGTVAGRRVLSSRLERLLGDDRLPDGVPRAKAPHRAMGFAVFGLALMIPFWILEILPGDGRLDLAASLGVSPKNRIGNSVDRSPSDHPSSAASPASGIVLNPASPGFVRENDSDSGSREMIGQQVAPILLPKIQAEIPAPEPARPPIPSGYSVPAETISPNGRFGVMAPDYGHHREGSSGQNALVDLASKRQIVSLNAVSWFKDANIRMSHVDVRCRWSADSTVLVWIVEGRFMTRSATAIRCADGKPLWQKDILTAARETIVDLTRRGAPDSSERVRRAALRNPFGSDGFLVSLAPPREGFSLPERLFVGLETNPKGIEGLENLDSGMEMTLAPDGGISYANFHVHSGGTGAPMADSEASVREFIRRHVRLEQSRDMGEIMKQYADRLDYWGQKLDKDGIARDKAEYFARWPLKTEEIQGDIGVTRDRSLWVAVYTTGFNTRNPSTGRSVRGTQRSTVTLVYENGLYRIVSESGKVIEKTPENRGATDAEVALPADPLPGERFPATRTRLIAAAEVAGLDQDSLRYAINEMFARHGAKFPKDEITRHFSQFGWYRPREGLTFDQIEAAFSEIEKQNLKLLGATRDARKRN